MLPLDAGKDFLRLSCCAASSCLQSRFSLLLDNSHTVIIIAMTGISLALITISLSVAQLHLKQRRIPLRHHFQQHLFKRRLDFGHRSIDHSIRLQIVLLTLIEQLQVLLASEMYRHASNDQIAFVKKLFWSRNSTFIAYAAWSWPSMFISSSKILILQSPPMSASVGPTVPCPLPRSAAVPLHSLNVRIPQDAHAAARGQFYHQRNEPAARMLSIRLPKDAQCPLPTLHELVVVISFLFAELLYRTASAVLTVVLQREREFTMISSVIFVSVFILTQKLSFYPIQPCG